MITEFENKQKELKEELTIEFRKSTDDVMDALRKDQEITQDVIEEFRNQDGADDASGIDGRFLRD